jgi:hypothetical protein
LGEISSHALAQDLGPAARQRDLAGALHRGQHAAHVHARDLDHLLDLGRGEEVRRDLGKALAQRADQSAG